MPAAYSYIRMSGPEQLKGDSLRKQLATSPLAACLRVVNDGKIPSGRYLLVENLT
jgi:hypothetical protein